ncbi:ABC transporter permease subunit [Roseomonas populi]|uniref:ABC transporter permease subunit n=1 Tax=Roseomonas populi TaxID=3121582 RepID=A0ABT1X4F3_9PROT|nr:ABC transporter permease subunit [Roseomonas pecuniae]MCR0982962.1 ABC transporter permease subunit [Roseomonas pecuniae]
MRRPLSLLLILLLLAPLVGLLLARGAGQAVAEPLGNSLLVALAAAAVGAPLGAMAGAGLRGRFLGRGLALGLIAMPVLLPTVLPAAALLLVAERLGGEARLPGLALWHALLGAPLVAAIILAALDRVDPRLYRAAQACGAEPELAARRLLRPHFLRAMALGAALVFALSLGESAPAVLLGAQTLPTALLAGTVAPLTPLLVAIVLAVAFLLGRGAPRPAGPDVSPGRSAPSIEENAP